MSWLYQGYHREGIGYIPHDCKMLVQESRHAYAMLVQESRRSGNKCR